MGIETRDKMKETTSRPKGITESVNVKDESDQVKTEIGDGVKMLTNDHLNHEGYVGLVTNQCNRVRRASGITTTMLRPL
ncbi:hypothetical protein ANTQUA_LOCUS4996 [Anthophora quadrimaculata]